MRFKVGELAILCVSRLGLVRAGSIVEVMALSPRKGEFSSGRLNDANGDYVISDGRDEYFIVVDWQLRKLDPPAEPSALTRQHDEELTA